MGIDGDDGSLVVLGGDGGEHDGGFAFEAADFDDGALRGSASGQSAEEAEFVVGEEAGDTVSALKGVVQSLVNVVGQLNHEAVPRVE